MKVIWKIFSGYMLIILLMLVCNNSFGQRICKKDVCVVEFNAGWNEANSVVWLDSLENCGIIRINIDKGDWKEKYNITVAIGARLEEVQASVDNVNMKKY